MDSGVHASGAASAASGGQQDASAGVHGQQTTVPAGSLSPSHAHQQPSATAVSPLQQARSPPLLAMAASAAANAAAAVVGAVTGATRSPRLSGSGSAPSPHTGSSSSSISISGPLSLPSLDALQLGAPATAVTGAEGDAGAAASSVRPTTLTVDLRSAEPSLPSPSLPEDTGLGTAGGTGNAQIPPALPSAHSGTALGGGLPVHALPTIAEREDGLSDGGTARGDDDASAANAPFNMDSIGALGGLAAIGMPGSSPDDSLGAASGTLVLRDHLARERIRMALAGGDSVGRAVTMPTTRRPTLRGVFGPPPGAGLGSDPALSTALAAPPVATPPNAPLAAILPPHAPSTAGAAGLLPVAPPPAPTHSSQPDQQPSAAAGGDASAAGLSMSMGLPHITAPAPTAYGAAVDTPVLDAQLPAILEGGMSAGGQSMTSIAGSNPSSPDGRGMGGDATPAGLGGQTPVTPAGVPQSSSNAASANAMGVDGYASFDPRLIAATIGASPAQTQAQAQTAALQMQRDDAAVAAAAAAALQSASHQPQLPGSPLMGVGNRMSRAGSMAHQPGHSADAAAGAGAATNPALQPLPPSAAAIVPAGTGMPVARTLTAGSDAGWGSDPTAITVAFASTAQAPPMALAAPVSVWPADLTSPGMSSAAHDAALAADLAAAGVRPAPSLAVGVPVTPTGSPQPGGGAAALSLARTPSAVNLEDQADQPLSPGTVPHAPPTTTAADRPGLISADVTAPVAVAPSDLFGAPAFAAGRAFSATTIDALLCEAHFAPHIIFIIKQLVRASRKQQLQLLPISDAIAMAMLVTPGNPTPPTAKGTPLSPQAVQPYPRIGTYGQLFESLLRGWHLLPVGLYRRREPGVPPCPPIIADPAAHFLAAFGGVHVEGFSAESGGNLIQFGGGGSSGTAGVFRNQKELLSYVFTNPPPTTILNKHDLVYVLRAGGDSGGDD